MADIITKGSTTEQDIPVRWVDQSDGTWAMKVVSGSGGSSTLQGGTLNAATIVSVTGTANTLIGANSTRKGLMIRADVANTQSCYYGPATVTASNGMEIRPGEIHTFNPGEGPTNLIQAISASGTQSIRVQDVG